MVSVLLVENIRYIIEKSSHYGVSTIRVSDRKGQVPSYLCTDTGWQMQMQVLSQFSL